MSKLKLTDEVGAKYRTRIIDPGSYDFPGYGRIDLHRLSLAEADKLVAQGFPFLEAKPAKQESKSKKESPSE